MEGGVVVEAAAAREQKKVEQEVVEEEEELGEEALGPLQPLQVAYAYHGETLLEKAETQASKGVNWLRSALGTASGTRKVTSLSSFSCFVFFIFFFHEKTRKENFFFKLFVFPKKKKSVKNQKITNAFLLLSSLLLVFVYLFPGVRVDAAACRRRVFPQVLGRVSRLERTFDEKQGRGT